MSTWLAFSIAANVALTASAPPKKVSFDEAIGLSVETPDVRGAERAVVDKHEMLGRISTMTSNPQLYLQPGFRLAPTPNQGVEVQASVMQSWNLAGSSSARLTTARLEEAELSVRARARALEQRLEAARAWIDLWSAEQVFELTKREAALGGDFARLVEKAANASAATKADLAEARAYHAEARLAVIAAEGEMTERGLLLARVLAAGPEALGSSGDLPTAPIPVGTNRKEALQRISNLPAVQAKTLEADVERARLAEEKAARGSSLSLGVYLQRDSPGGFVAYGAVGLTLPLFDQGERERSVTVARVAQLSGETKRETANAAVDLALGLHEVDHTQEVVDTMAGTLIPALEEALANRLRIFEGGESTILEVITARRNLTNARGRLERARAQNAWARVKVWLWLS
ncbi:MAG TPA: TolC family protein, partial [Polyangium sp.]|nr:TolC family protein [Polyangium sp.]